MCCNSCRKMRGDFNYGALSICMWNLKKDDYHKERYSYMYGVKEKLLLSLPPNCVFVVDNSTYSKLLCETCPTSSKKKEDV
jgi:hypothetical protein